MSIAVSRPAGSRSGLFGSDRSRSLIYHGFVLAFGFIMLYPLMWMVASSLKPADRIFSTSEVLSLIPSRVIIENYTQGWAGFGGISFLTFFRNSFIYAGFGTLLV